MSLDLEIEAALHDLRRIQDADGDDFVEQAVAGLFRAKLEDLLLRIRCQERRVIFIGPVGVGKSSVLSAAAGLYVDGRPTTPDQLLDRAVLPLGSGKTTAWPVLVRAPESPEMRAEIFLDLVPLGRAELRVLVETIADNELFTRMPDTERGEERRPDPMGEELRRAILNMSGYAERVEVYFDGNLKRTRTIRPLDGIVATQQTLKGLTEHLLERMTPAARTRCRWSFPNTDEGLHALRHLLGRINQGQELTAPLPERIVLTVPALAGISTFDGPLQLFDTRGLDGNFSSRADLFQALREPDALLVLCSFFVNAPSPELRDVLRALGRDRSLWAVRDRLVLLVIDKGEGAGVVGANRDRELGQILRADDCWRTLETERLSTGLRRENVLVFDALRDDPEALLMQLGALHANVRAHLEQEAWDELEDAQPLRNGESATKAQDAIIDEQIRMVLRRYRLVGEPMDDPLLGLRIALASCPYALRIRATLRCDGLYWSLDLLNAVESEARAAVSAWLLPLLSSLVGRLEDLEEDDELITVRPRLKARRRALADAFERTIVDYGRDVRAEVERHSKGADIWVDVLSEWGKGAGFRSRVVERFERWGKLQPFSAHRTTRLVEHLPLLAEVEQPDVAPGFTILADNLRRLRRLSWSLEGVNLLVGANGAGKTTTLSVLRFFAAVLTSGSDSAVSQILAARSNLRTWGVDEDEPVRLALQKGETWWEFELRPLADQKSVAIRERLVHRGEEVFSVSELRRVTWRGADLGHVVGSDCGLAYLVKLNKVDLPVQRIATLAEGLHSYRVPNLHLLKEGGTRPLPERPLEPSGGNAFSVLQRMKDAPGQEGRYTFVLESLQLAFPGLVHQLGFNLTETSVELFVVPPDGGPPNYIGQEADGVLQLLVNLVAVASAAPGEVIALDQPDDHLHPYAARMFLRQIERWAHQRRLTIILATHSVVLLDEMKRSPERVFVMTPNKDGVVPNALPELYNRDWLDSFELGELYKNDEIGSNADDV